MLWTTVRSRFSFGVGHPLWREDGSVVYNCCWSLSGLSPAGIMTLFLCLKFETPRTWRARSPYLHPPGAGWKNKISSSVVEKTDNGQSQSYITTDGQSTSLSWCQARIWDPRQIFLLFKIIFIQLQVCWYGVPSLMRSRVYSSQLLLGFASAVFIGSEPRRTHHHICTGRPGSSTYFPQEQGSPVIPQAFTYRVIIKEMMVYDMLFLRSS
jgi:hypothetical protein